MEIQKIRLKNFLSFGEKTKELEFSNLNTIVGPNDSGKTNVFRAIEMVKKHMSQRETPAEAYYHNLDFEKPYEIEIDVKFNLDEQQILENFFVCGCLSQGIRPVEKENTELKEHILKKILLGNGRKHFSDFCKEITIVVDTEGKSRYPPDIYFKFQNKGRYLYFQGHRITKKPKRRGSYSIQNMSDIILNQARNAHPSLNDYVKKEKVKLPNLEKFSTHLFDYLYNHTDETLSSEFGGFRFAEFEANKETFPEFIRIRNFFSREKPEESGANLFDMISLMFSRSIIKTSDIRARPKKIVNPEDRLFLNELINITGENIPKILFSLAHSDDPKLKSQYREITSELKRIMGLEMDIQVKPIKKKIKKRAITDLGPSVARLDNASDIAITDQETEYVENEVNIQILKNGIPIPVEFAAAGVIELLIILTTVIGQKNKVLLLDEPALNLHSVLQKRVLNIINQAVIKNHNQVILITHSPFLLNPDTFEHTWKFSSTKNGTQILNLREIMDSMSPDEKGRTVTRLRNSEIRSILFQHGIILVEGPSDRMVLEKIDRFMIDNEMNGPNIEDNEWMILDVGGKDSMSLFINLAKKLHLPHTSVMDFDSLMQCIRRIKLGSDDVRTSSVIGYIEKTDGLSKQEQNLIKKLESTIIKKHKKNNEKTIQFWYPDEKLEQLKKIALTHNMYVLTKDLEGVIRTTSTSRDSKPLKDLDQITELLSQNKIPGELKSTMNFIKTKISKRKH